MTELGSCRLTAESGGEGFDLAAGFVERAGTINFLRGVAQFFLDRKLRGHARAGFSLTVTASD